MKSKSFKFSYDGFKEAQNYNPHIKVSTLVILGTTIALNVLILSLEASNPVTNAFVPSQIDSLVKAFKIANTLGGI